MVWQRCASRSPEHDFVNMDDCLLPQVIISSVSNVETINWNVQDLHTGAIALSVKGEYSSPRTLALVGCEFLISGYPGKAIVNIWPLGDTKKVQKMVVPGEVTALAASRRGIHIVAAIDTKLHLWEVTTGKLIAVISRHYKKINCIKFTDDGSHFIVGGADGLVTVWELSQLMYNGQERMAAGNNALSNEPCFSWLNHKQGVTDIHVGLFGAEGRAVTVSEDETCRLYQISTGQLLFSVFMGTPLTSVTMDSAEFAIYLGSSDSKIYRVQLSLYATCSEFFYSPEEQDVFVYEGHRQTVCCLSVSLDGETLVSGSEDHTIKLWNILGGQCTKTFEQPGSVSNLLVIMSPPMITHMGEKKYMVPKFKFSPLERKTSEETEPPTEEDLLKNVVPVCLEDQELKTWVLSSGFDILEGINNPGEVGSSKSQMTEELRTAKQTNKDIFNYLVDQLSVHL